MSTLISQKKLCNIVKILSIFLFPPLINKYSIEQEYMTITNLGIQC